MDRLLRDVAMAMWLGALLLQPLLWRPELLVPTEIGSDSSNYRAAAERFAAGHDLYTLAPGDRPAPVDNPPEWTAAILSPPPIGLAYLWQVPIPDTAGIYLSWAIGLAAIAVLGQILIGAARPALTLLLLLATPSLAVTAWSGNVNAIIGPAALLVWWASGQSGRWQVLAGAIVAVLACIKIGPLFLGVWLLGQRRWLAVGAAIVAAAIITAATAVITGLSAFRDYLAVALSTTATPTPMSIPGIARALGAPLEVQAASLPIVMIVAVGAILALRRSPWSFAIAALALAFSTSVVRLETAAIAVVGAAAWTARSEPDAREPLWRRIVVPTALGAVLATVAVGFSLQGGGLHRSSLAFDNRSERPVVFRLSLVLREASFGYLVPAGQSLAGWIDRAGSSPPLVTIWSTDCQLLGEVPLPSDGGQILYDDTGARIHGTTPGAHAFAGYESSCFEELKALMKARASIGPGGRAMAGTDP
jgi:hypothetical protein